METNLTGPRWAARMDARKISGDYSDLLRLIASSYDMYDRGYRILGPWINRTRDMDIAIPPDKSTLTSSTKPRSNVSHLVHTSFVDALYNFALQSKGKRQMINPDVATHHSAQFVNGTFIIKGNEVHLFGCSEPLIVSGSQLLPESIGFIIVRPKLGKLGTASATNWEILFYKQPLGYQIDHVDSNLNPRWSGIM
jgi:hypothetical protein